MFDWCLGSLKKEEIDFLQYCIDRGEFPIMTRQPMNSYNRPLEEDDFVWFPYTPEESTSVLLLSQTGTLKTVLAKRFLDYFYHMGCYCMVFDVKGDEWIKAKRSSHIGGLHPLETPHHLKILPLRPGFAGYKMPDKILEDYKEICMNINDFDQLRDWTTLGVSEGAADMVINLAKKTNNINKVYEQISSKTITKDIHSESRRSAMKRLRLMMEDKFFGRGEYILNLYKVWNQGYVPVFGLFQSDARYQCSFIGKMSEKARDVSAVEYAGSESVAKSTDNITPKFIFYDDSEPYAGNTLDENTTMSVIVIKYILTLWRYWKINCVVSIQNPRMLNEKILSECKYWLIGYCAGYEYLFNYIKDYDVQEAIKGLDFHYNPRERKIPWILVHPGKRDWEMGYPLMPMVGHFD